MALTMLSRVPSIAYPDVRQGEGHWAPVTSTLDWCEEVSLTTCGGDVDGRLMCRC